MRICFAFAVTGIEQFVMSFEVGVVLEDDAQWQAPAHCFPDDDDEGNTEDDGHFTTTSSMEAAKLLRKLAGAAAF